ncbi:MAG: ABC transporter permease [Roseovarius sp.]
MKKLKPDLGILYLVLAYVFIFLPVVVLVMFSFTSRDLPLPPFEGPSLKWYARILSDQRMLQAMVNSILLAGISSLVATFLGFLGAYGVARHKTRWDGLIRYAMMAPITVSYLIIGMGLLVSFHALGLPKSLWVVGIGHVVLNLPICFAIILAGMGDHQRNIEQAAHDLGASDLQALLFVTLPVMRPSLFAAFCLSFTFSWDEFIIAFLLTRFEVTLPVLLFEMLRAGSNPLLNAAGSLVFLISICLVLAAVVLTMRQRRG